MKIVVDTNILFSYFWKGSTTRNLLNLKIIDYYIPKYAIKELDKYKKTICKKTKQTNKEYKKIKKDLQKKVKIVNLDKYKKEFKNLKNIPDKKDIDFIALSKGFKCILWSNDKDLRKQEYVRVINTKDFLEILRRLNNCYIDLK